jgi:hypothetical protein
MDSSITDWSGMDWNRRRSGSLFLGLFRIAIFRIICPEYIDQILRKPILIEAKGASRLPATERAVCTSTTEHRFHVHDRDGAGCNGSVIVCTPLTVTTERKLMSKALNMCSTKLRRRNAILGTASPVHVTNGIYPSQSTLKIGSKEA